MGAESKAEAVEKTAQEGAEKHAYSRASTGRGCEEGDSVTAGAGGTPVTHDLQTNEPHPWHQGSRVRATGGLGTPGACRESHWFPMKE